METRVCERERKRELEIERSNWRGRERFGDPDESRDYLFLWGSERERGREREGETDSSIARRQSCQNCADLMRL